MSLLRDMLGAIAERGRAIVDLSTISAAASPLEQILALCEQLLSSRGEATGLATAAEILDRYQALDRAEHARFCEALLQRFGPDMEPLIEAARAFAADPTSGKADALHRISEPRRQQLFRLLNQSANGMHHLISMRADLLSALREHPELAPVDQDFQHLFRSWFNRGFLELRRIDWSTPAVILERIIRYEAVHEIADWDDLRRRIDTADRRLYAFFHPRLPDEPLIFVEVALTRSVAASIQAILDPGREIIDGAAANTAVFYSISDCQNGLRGISFGNFLIKQVVAELGAELPHITRFVTLSPVPQFSKWLRAQWSAPALAIVREKLVRDGWWDEADSDATLAQPLTALAAWYLTRVRDGGGRLLDPVARFHLRNGARLERVNWRANSSPSGMESSCGIMVNYLYELDDIERNHERFVSGQPPAVSGAVRRLANVGGRLLNQAIADDAAQGGT
jgi:malonyl-CoA decarboxylase